MVKQKPVRTLAELAAMANVSTMTVSRALRGRPEVDPETCRRIQKLAQELQYRPNTGAARFRKGKTGMVGTVLQTEAAPLAVAGQVIVGDFLVGISQHLSEYKYHGVPIFERELQADDGPEGPVFFRERCVDGLICMVDSSDQAKQVLRKQQTPVIWLDTTEQQSRNCIWRDEYQAVVEALRALRDAGHRKIAYVRTEVGRVEPQRHPSAVQRSEAYTRCVCDAGLVPQKMDVKQLISRLLKGKKTPSKKSLTAAICYGLREAFMLSRLCAEHGIVIPRDLSVVSLDANIASNYYWPQLSCVPYDRQQAGELAAQMLLKLIDGQKFIKSVILPAESVVGQTILPC
tara:strand:+ start:1165 stop:2199 length:1035 start_codon:yes stop_codon:yes gene_type:complete